MSNIAIEIHDLWKSFRYETNGGFDTVKELIISALKNKRPAMFEKELYHGLSLQIQRGETVAFLGRNGSGKSTLLKLISGIYQPDRGRIRVGGRLSPLIELGAGFHPEFSGIENVLVYAQVLGIPKDQARRLLPAIIDFAGIGDFAYQPVRLYSSGMYMRLAFSVAVNIDPEVLVVDEILAVGDFEFSRKCFARMDEFKRSGKTVCLVSHDLATVASWATRGVVLDGGSVVFDGPAAEAVAFFRDDIPRLSRAQSADVREPGRAGMLETKRFSYPVALKPLSVAVEGSDSGFISLVVEAPVFVSPGGFARRKWLRALSVLRDAVETQGAKGVRLTVLSTAGSIECLEREVTAFLDRPEVSVHVGFAESVPVFSSAGAKRVIAVGWRATARAVATFEWFNSGERPRVVALWDSVDEAEVVLSTESQFFLLGHKAAGSFLIERVEESSCLEVVSAAVAGPVSEFSVIILCDFGLDSSCVNISLRALNQFLEDLPAIERVSVRIFSVYRSLGSFMALGQIPVTDLVEETFLTSRTVVLHVAPHAFFAPTLAATREAGFRDIGFFRGDSAESSTVLAEKLRFAWEGARKSTSGVSVGLRCCKTQESFRDVKNSSLVSFLYDGDVVNE